MIRKKDEALRFFKKVNTLADNERGSKLLAFRSDHGGEFNSVEFSEFCEENGVKHFTTAPYMPQQNGVVERRIRPSWKWPGACSRQWLCRGRFGERR